MKNLFLLIVLIVCVSCLQNTKNADKTGENKTENNLDCKPEDILILTRKDMETEFFRKLDAVISKQYPEEKEKQTIDITPELLNQFLRDLNINTLKNDSVFQKKYGVKLTSENTETRNESNTMELMYFPQDCTYRLSVNNYYETNEFSDERSVSYSFKIENGHVTAFRRQEAG
ncbi:hypothetical protein [Empedobacter brevis]|uniref:hypothetical protein n=1 Tax=Empedobacter brevis TaxID=247 RepID=UPI002FE41D7C